VQSGLNKRRRPSWPARIAHTLIAASVVNDPKKNRWPGGGGFAWSAIKATCRFYGSANDFQRLGASISRSGFLLLLLLLLCLLLVLLRL
jgi:hypothetical protein